jgi:adenine phosphoribosyltransferase
VGVEVIGGQERSDPGNVTGGQERSDPGNVTGGQERSDPGNVTEVAAVIASLTREVADFPEPGIQFKDLTPLLADAQGLATVTNALAAIAEGADLVAGIDARGFLLGAAVATKLGTGVLAVRKGGKLPPPVHSESYSLEYGTATLEVPADGIDIAGRKILIIDDVLATGGTIAATARLLGKAGAVVTGAAVILELSALGGRERLQPLPVTSLYVV